MKFSWFDKLLLVVVLLLVIALAALCIGIAMSFVTADMAAHVTGIVTNGMTENRLIMGGIGLVLLILALRLFIAMKAGTAGSRTESDICPHPFR